MLGPPFVTGKPCFSGFGLSPPRTPRKRGFGPKKWGSGGVLGDPPWGSFFGVPGVVFSGSGGPRGRGWGSPKTGVPGVQKSGIRGPPGGGPKIGFFRFGIDFSDFGGPGGHFGGNPGFWPKVGVVPKSSDFWTPTLIGVRIDFFQVFRKTPVLGVGPPIWRKSGRGTLTSEKK